MGNCRSQSGVVAVPDGGKTVQTSSENQSCECAPEKARTLNANEKLVEEWIKCFGDHTFDKLLDMTRPDALFNFESADAEMTCNAFVESVACLRASFPDITFRWESLEEISPGHVLVKNFGAQGTHTGVPFAFDPYPPIPSANKSFEDPPLNFTLSVGNDSKITHGLIYSFGVPVGPPGIYQQIGGILI